MPLKGRLAIQSVVRFELKGIVELGTAIPGLGEDPVKNRRGKVLPVTPSPLSPVQSTMEPLVLNTLVADVDAHFGF